MAAERQVEFQTLSEDRCWQLLAQKNVGRLAVWIDDGPDIFPVNYRIEEETLVLRTAPGLKLTAATMGRGVAFEVDALDDLHHTGWSVVVRGAANEVTDPEELVELRRLLVEPWVGGSRSHYLRIVPTAVSGRQLPGSPGGGRPDRSVSRPV
ncbi:MAG: pyridoxamine 5'-phosphate oxidase family protein [Acidimicrobiales bacterium]